MKVKVRRLAHSEGLPLPDYQTADAAGFDLVAAVPETTPVVIALCACAASGAPMTPAIAAMANILYRMFNSFAMMHARLRRHALDQFIAWRIVPGKRRSHTRPFLAFLARGGT